MTEIVDNILEEINQNNLVAGVYLDLSKAFDTVDHKILLEKLKHYGVRGGALGWFTNYLTNREQYTVANGVCSHKQSVHFGVPQGSVLGPLLFLVYVNDIAASTGEHKLRLFADDSNVFIVNKDAGTLKKQIVAVINDMNKWFKANKLTINMSKTAYSIFSKQNTIVPTSLNSMHIDGNTVNRVQAAKYLGIILDDKLNWGNHIEELNKKLTKTTQAFKIVKNFVDKKSKFMLFYAYFESRAQYGSELYCTANRKLIKSVQVKQNRALKALFYSAECTSKEDFIALKLMPTKKLHSDLGVLMIEDMGNLNTLKLVHKTQCNEAPSAFDGYFVQNKDIPGRRQGTRQDDELSTSKYKTNTLKKTIKYRGAKLWNDVDVSTKNLELTKDFGKHVKYQMVTQY